MRNKDINYSVQCRIIMYDPISRFKWNVSKLPRDFSIAPAVGYCSPGMDVNFVVSFRPTRHDSLIEGNVSIYNFYLYLHKYSIFGENLISSYLQYTPNTKVVYCTPLYTSTSIFLYLTF